MNKRIILLVSVLLMSAAFVKAQVAENTSDLDKLKDVKNQAEAYFIEGLNAVKNNQRPQARVSFDKSVEIFLMFPVTMQENRKLHECRDQVIETIYRIEFPNDEQPPNIKNLSEICDWNLEN